MVSSKATTVADYLKELPENRRRELAAVRRVIRKHLPRGYVETMDWGMICYEIPLKRYPVTYNKRPLAYAALAAQKQYNALYMMAVDGGSARERRLRDGFRRIGSRLNMGKCCIRFQSADDLPLDVIGELIAEISVDQYIAQYEKGPRGRA